MMGEYLNELGAGEKGAFRSISVFAVFSVVGKGRKGDGEEFLEVWETTGHECELTKFAVCLKGLIDC